MNLRRSFVSSATKNSLSLYDILSHHFLSNASNLVYKSWVIPRGTAVMESSYLIHTDPSIYPDPLAFRPERWIENPGLTKFFFPFSKGSRSCLGMNLAISELYFCIAMLWRSVQLEIYDTIEERDVFTNYDAFIGMPDISIGGGIRVKVLEDIV